MIFKALLNWESDFLHYFFGDIPVIHEPIGMLPQDAGSSPAGFHIPTNQDFWTPEFTNGWRAQSDGPWKR